LFAPIVHENYWWLYAVNCQTKQLFVLDRKRINNVVVRKSFTILIFFLKCLSTIVFKLVLNLACS